MYLFDLSSTADRLVRAHRRGVHVQVILDDGEDSKQYKKVRHALGQQQDQGQLHLPVQARLHVERPLGACTRSSTCSPGSATRNGSR